MEKLLMVTASILAIFGALLLISPDAVKKISDFFNKTVFHVDEKIFIVRRTVGIIFLILGIIQWYIVLKK